MFWKPVDLFICGKELLFLGRYIDKPRLLRFLHEWSSRSRTKWNTVGDTFELEERIIRLHTFDIDLIRSFFWCFEIEVMRPFVVKYLGRVLPCLIHRFRDKNSFFFRELEVDITELRSLMSDPGTISICDEISMIDLMVLASSF